MKYIVLLLVFFTTQFVLAQDASTYENATKAFQKQFNAQDTDAIFDMYTTEMQETMTKEGVARFVKGCYKQFGNLNDITFIETAEGVNSYTAVFDKANLGMDLQLDANGKISTIQFQEL
ncbi:DUF3887 domain-containing protein [Aquimarina sediminis]|uniref:DUF3887 domain-containing protein n=1 Tax=Aquimarina sediminis TaxID=2070536 RepID=UPI000CA031FC|nr:DUF3887 domain-containing protein [Aquimarina sediminis]